jgi:CheY-like chemotaxis protein
MRVGKTAVGVGARGRPRSSTRMKRRLTAQPKKSQDKAARIVIIDDDPAMELLADGLRYRGHEARRVPDASLAIRSLREIVKADLIILDILMPTTAKLAGHQSNPSAAGMDLLRQIRKHRPNLPVIALSATQDATIIEALKDDPATKFVSKWESHPVREIISLVSSSLGIPEDLKAVRPFIVHGHADLLKLQLKNYIQNVLGLPEPVILHEQPNLGRSIIEKFEDHAAAPSLVFVLLTPDDIVADASASDDAKRRARQNVVFEMGYFLGALGRKSGRVLLLYKGPLELPSDIGGVVYIDISDGIEAAGETIRREICNAAV